MLSQEQILKNIAENIHYFEARTDADDPWGERDIMKLSIGCTLRFYNGHNPEIRAIMPQLVKSFYDQFGQYFTGGYMINKESQKVKTGKLTPKLLEKCFSPDAWKNIEEPISLNWGSSDSDTTTGSQFTIWLGDEYVRWDYLSTIRLAVYYEKPGTIELLHAFIKHICQFIPLHSGYVGYISSLPSQWYSYQEHQTPIAYRFYGCEIDDGLDVPLNFPPLGIKGINWLTILGPAFIEQMGGTDKLSQEAAALNLGVERAGENLIIQAGPYPDICDNQMLPMNPYYVAANHLLKPIRKATIGSLHMDSMTGKAVLDTAASDAWLRRFDQYPLSNTAPPSVPNRYTGRTLRVGDTCTSTGWYEALLLNNRREHFTQGQVVGGEPLSAHGQAIVWYELTPEAAKEYSHR